MATQTLTVAQAVVRFLAAQYCERDGERVRLIPGAFGIFGHGNVAGIGQALLQNAIKPDDGEAPLPYYLARNEQAMVHAATAFSRTRERLQTMACTSSIGPGSTNMVTGAALATIDRIPVLLLPSDYFATRRSGAVLQQLENPANPDASVNDAFKPVSVFWDRIIRPEQLADSLMSAMAALTDPARAGAVTLCLPQDVQAEAYDFDTALFAERTWHSARPRGEVAALKRAGAVIGHAKRPLIVAGGGVIYSGAAGELREFAEQTGIPVADTQAGKGAIAGEHPLSVGGVGSTGSAAANELAAGADVVIGIGTRYSDFTTASRTAFSEDARFVNINITAFDAAKHAGEMVVADAASALAELAGLVAGYRVPDSYTSEVASLRNAWRAEVGRLVAPRGAQPVAQVEVFGALNELMGADDVLINAAGSMPGDLQAIWDAPGPGTYHVEYGYSCMGYELPAAIGTRLGRVGGDVVAIVGDGTYQMMPAELATIAQERLKVIVVVLVNGGFGSIGALSQSVGSQRFGTAYRMREETSGMLTGPPVPVDFALNARSFGVRAIEADSIEEFRAAYRSASAAEDATVIVVRTDPLGEDPRATNGWDVPVSEVSRLDTTQEAYERYRQFAAKQHRYL